MLFSARCAILPCVAALLFLIVGSAYGEQTWTEVRSPHFRVLTDGTGGDARKVAFEFEQIRHVFVLRFHKEDIWSGAPLTIIAAQNAGTLMQLAPALWKEKGETLSGFYLPRWEAEYAVVRMDTWGDNHQVVSYYDYTQSILHANAHWIPNWLDVGWSEFYAYTQVQRNEILVGSPSLRSRQLHQLTLIPVSIMLEVNARSPYLTDEFKRDLFYAEAWGMVHYMMFGDGMGNGSKLNAFFQKLQDGVPQKKAFESTFGDVGTFDRGFSQYVSQGAFKASVFPADAAIDAKSFAQRKLTQAEADYEIGRFYVTNRDGKRGRALIEKALTEDPSLAGAHEELGYLHYDMGEDEDARKEWQAAVALDPTQARSVFALIMMGKSIASQSPGELRATQLALQHVTEMDPKFAPAYVELASVEARQGTTQQAYKDARQAETLEPGRAGYHLLTGRILLMGNQPTVAANYSRFVAERWYGSDRNEAVDLWQTVPVDQRGDGPTPAWDVPAGVQVVHGTFLNVSCASTPIETLKFTFQPDVPVGAKPLEFMITGRRRIGFADTFWWGGDHYNTCFRLSGHPGMVAYKPTASVNESQPVIVELRDDTLDSAVSGSSSPGKPMLGSARP